MLLLEGIARHALAFDREEYREFHATLGKLAAALKSTQDPAGLVALAEAACEALANYNREAQRVHGAQTVELRCMIEMLGQTLVSLAQAGGQSVEALQAIGKEIEGARQINDIRLLRVRLGDSLKTISDEARKQRERNAEMLRFAEDAALIASKHQEDSEIDPVTGLPSPEKAEREISKRLGPGADSCAAESYAVIFLMERLEGINLRYGHATGDRLLKVFAQFLASKMAPNDEVFRWRGPTFVALLSRVGSADNVRAEVARFASGCQEWPIEVNGQTVKIPLACKWTVLKLTACAAGGEACQRIDRFVAEHGVNAPAP